MRILFLFSYYISTTIVRTTTNLISSFNYNRKAQNVILTTEHGAYATSITLKQTTDCNWSYM